MAELLSGLDQREAVSLCSLLMPEVRILFRASFGISGVDGDNFGDCKRIRERVCLRFS